MNFYAVPRMTRDIDIIAEVLPKDSNQLYHLFKQDCYVDQEDILDAAKTSGSFNMIHNKTLVKIDVLMRKQDPYRKMEFSRRKKQRIFSFDVYVVSPEDLILSKLHWSKASGSEMQSRDVKNLANSVKTLDWDYLTEWARTLGIAEQLKAFVP